MLRPSASAPAEVVRGDADRRDRHRAGADGRRARGRAGAVGSTSSMPGRLTTTIVASRRSAPGSRQSGRSARLSAPIRKKSSSPGPLAADGRSASRRCNAARAGWPRYRRPRTPGARRSRSGPSPGGATRRPIARLVRRLARHHEPDPVEPARLAALLGQDQVPQVDRVERPPKSPSRMTERSLNTALTHFSGKASVANLGGKLNLP